MKMLIRSLFVITLLSLGACNGGNHSNDHADSSFNNNGKDTSKTVPEMNPPSSTPPPVIDSTKKDSTHKHKKDTSSKAK